MRTPRIAAALALLAAAPAVSPALAQDAAPSPTSELAALRSDYEDALRRLLQKHVAADDVAAAAEVSRELDRISPAPPEPESGPAPVGTWKWIGYSFATFGSNGIVTSGQNKGVWKWTDQAAGKFRVAWVNGYVDEMTVAPNGKLLHGVNNEQSKFVAHFVAPEKKSPQTK